MPVTDTEVPMTTNERKPSRRAFILAVKPRYVREHRLRRPYYWLMTR